MSRSIYVLLVAAGAIFGCSSTGQTSSPDGGGGTTGAGGTGPGGVPGAKAGVGAKIGSCEIFPTDNAWNVEVDGAGVQVIHTYDAHLSPGTSLHPDWGDYTKDHYGIPFNPVGAGQKQQPTVFSLYASQSDPGPGGWVGANPVTGDLATGTTAYPFFVGMKIEGDPGAGGTPGKLRGDQHAIILEQGASGCTSYEAWQCVGGATAPPFQCANGAVFDLSSNALRPAGWTSGDAGGLCILAGLVRLAEVQAGAVNHAIRVTFDNTQSGYIPPATHSAGSSALGGSYPPMGLRLRLKASVVTTSYTKESQVVMAAMKTYGVIIADNGSDWYFQGDSDDGWDANGSDGQDSLIAEISGDFHHLKGSDFEAVYSGKPVDTGE